MSRLHGWRAGWQKPDRRPLWEWAFSDVDLPATYAQPGHFDVRSSRYLIGPFAAFQNDLVREITCLGAIQTAKSLWLEICTAYALANSPGPMSFTMQTDDDAKEHCEQRFFPMLKNVPRIRAMLPREKSKETKTKIYFGAFYLVVNGANINNLQRVSLRYKFNSELWLWKQGLLQHARNRVSEFERAGNSKVCNESQGGNVGDDLSKAYDSGNQCVWGIRCFGCNRLTPLEFSARMVTDPKARAGVIWSSDAKGTDGRWNIARAMETCRWRCRECGHEHDDTPRTRALWNDSGDYVAQRPDAPPDTVSFRWEALVSRPMSKLVKQFLEAREAQKMGLVAAMQDFIRQRRALPWKGESADATVLLKKAGYNLTDEKIGDKIANEAFRFATIDRQRDHFWMIVAAWRSDGSSRLLYRSRIETAEQCEDVRQRFNVEPQLTFEDSSYFPEGAYKDGSRFGWTALRGSGENYFTIDPPRGQKFRRLWSNVSQILYEGKLIPLIHWASDPIKDILHRHRSGGGPSFEIADDAGADFERQMNGEHKKETLNKKTGRPEWRWFRRHANHYFDCYAMQVAAALMVGLLAAPAAPDGEEVDPAAAASKESPPPT